jgi:hypothetical protein
MAKRVFGAESRVYASCENRYVWMDCPGEINGLSDSWVPIGHQRRYQYGDGLIDFLKGVDKELS